MRFHTIRKKGSSVVAFCVFRRGCRLSCSTSLCVGTTVDPTQMPQLLSGFCVFPDVFQHPPSPTDETEILIAETIGSSLAGGQRAEGVAEGAPPAPVSLALAKATDPARRRFQTIQKKGSSVVALCVFRRGCRLSQEALVQGKFDYEMQACPESFR